jgi:hypothetical protein
MPALDALKKASACDAHLAENWLDLFQSDAVHEFLFDPALGRPAHLACVVALHRSSDQPIVWIDAEHTLYPPAFSVETSRLHLFRPRPVDLAWAVTECLRCARVGVVIATLPDRLTSVEVRRLQLAAKHGGTLGILLRPNLTRAGVHIYSSASRWLVLPAPGERTIQRWRVEHVHGHGRQFGPSFIVEKHRATGQTHFVHPSSSLADYPATAAAS